MDDPSANGDLQLLDGVSWRGAAVPGERSHDLLALLALSAPHAVGDARLLEDVWAEHAPPSSTKALQVLVSRIRSGTDATVVERSGHGYRLGRVDVDYLSLCRHTEAARAATDAGDPGTARREARAALATPLAETGTTDRGPLAELRSAARHELDQARELLGRALSVPRGARRGARAAGAGCGEAPRRRGAARGSAAQRGGRARCTDGTRPLRAAP